MLTDRNILYVTATLSPNQLFGYAKVKSDNNKTGFLVFHYGAETNLRKLPSSRSAVFSLFCFYEKNTSIFFEAANIDRKQVLLEIANASVTWSSHVLFDRAVEVSFKEKCFTMKVKWLVKPIDSF